MDVGQHLFSVSYSCFCILKVKCAFFLTLSVSLMHVKIPDIQVGVSLKSPYLNVHDGPGFC